MSARRQWSALAVPALAALLACTQREQPHGAVTTDAGAPSSASAAPPAPPATPAPPAPAPPASSLVTPAPARTASTPPLAEKDWVWRLHRGDHFTVLLPGEPKVTVMPEEDDKVGYTEARVDVPGGQVSFTAGFSDFPQSEVDKPDAFLDDHATPPRRGFTDVLHKRSITLPGGQPGRVLILRRNLSGTPLRVYSRLYLVGRRLYSLIVSTLDVGGVSEDVVKKFMDSFKLA